MLVPAWSVLASTEVQEVLALVPEQTHPCCCDSFMRTVGDSALFFLEEVLNHLGDREGVDDFSPIGPGPKVDVFLLR